MKRKNRYDRVRALTYELPDSILDNIHSKVIIKVVPRFVQELELAGVAVSLYIVLPSNTTLRISKLNLLVSVHHHFSDQIDVVSEDE